MFILTRTSFAKSFETCYNATDKGFFAGFPVIFAGTYTERKRFPLHTEIVKTDHEGILATAHVIRDGGLCAMPTETVYGLAANGLDPEAVKEIYRVKGRPQDNPLILHIASLGELFPLVEIDPGTEATVRLLAARFWPGPLTMVLPRSRVVPDVITAGGPTVAIRMPSHPAAHALIAASGVPIAAPSANLSGKPSPTTLRDVTDDLTGRIPLILDGGDASVGVESTVIDLTRHPFDVLRPGGVSREALQAALGEEVGDASVPSDGKPPRSPGMKYRHYAPAAPLTGLVGNGNASLRYLASLPHPENNAAVVFDEYREKAADLGYRTLTYGAETDHDAHARLLFLTLREADRTGAERIYIQISPDRHGRGEAVFNRLSRSAGGDLVYLPDP